MPWFKVDDRLHCHPKWVAASAPARALWTTAGSWAAGQAKDGVVPRHMLGIFGGKPREAAELVSLGLWDVDGDGWKFHGWLDFQPSAEQVEGERAAARERQRRARDKSRESRRDGTVTDAVTHAVTSVPPTRPDPTRPSLTPSSPVGDTRGESPYRFEDFWQAYPKRNGRRVGRAQALVRWNRLTDKDKAAAFCGVAHYRDDCDNERTIAKDAARWLRDRCWEDWQDEADPVRTLAKQERRLVNGGLVAGYLEACNPNGRPAITTGAT